MIDIVHAIQSGSTSLWIFIPTAIVLGILHGLEPGHSKTMMAAFIIAIRGTIFQAVLLGLAAAISHSLLIAVLAVAALYLGSHWNADTIEPYLQLVSAVCVFGMACWMFWRTRRDLAAAHDHHHHHHHHHHHGHGHGHSHDDHDHHHEHEHDESFLLEFATDKLELHVFEDGVPPVFRLRAHAGAILPAAASVTLNTVRQDGTTQAFHFAAKEDFLESLESIPEPHEFAVAVTVEKEGAKHTANVDFHEDHDHHHHSDEREHDHHHHDHDHDSTEFQDAHELEHAEDIKRRFAGRTVTTPQIVMFGVTGGLVPCPAAFSVLVICLQLKRVALGLTLVACFSFGLAITMVATGALAAWSVQKAQKKFRGFGELMRRAPYISCVLLLVVAGYMAWHGWRGLSH